MIRLVIADDQPLVRAGLAMLLRAEPDFEIVAEVSDGAAAVEAVAAGGIDVVVMDLRMPGMDGTAATAAIVADRNRLDHLTKVLVLTTFNDDVALYGSLRAGASGFLLKHIAPKELVSAIRAVAHGDAWIDPAVTSRVIAAVSMIPATSPELSEVMKELTPREREVLVLMATGLSTAEITARLVLSEATVKTHICRILTKTGSRDRAQVVAKAYQSGLVSVPTQHR